MNHRAAGRALTTIASGQFLSFACSMIRNSMLAHWLGPVEFGSAAALLLVLSFFDALLCLGADRLFVQSTSGDDPKLQANAQCFQFMVGTVEAMLLWYLAPWLAGIVAGESAPQLALHWLAVVPLLRGLEHFDHRRRQRAGEFLYTNLVEIIPLAVSAACIVPLAGILLDHRAALVAIVLQVAVSTMLSHSLAERQYRWRFDAEVMKQLWQFGVPMAGSGVLVFLMTSGDRLLVGSYFGRHELATFTAAWLLCGSPGIMLAAMGVKAGLPYLATAQHDQHGFRIRYGTVAGLFLLSGISLAGLLVCFGPLLVSLLFGKEIEARAVISCLSLAAGFRLCRAAPSLAALALGEAKTTFYANVIRGIFLIAAWLSLQAKMPAMGLAVYAVVGEAVALVGAFWLLWNRHQIRASDALGGIRRLLQSKPLVKLATPSP